MRRRGRRYGRAMGAQADKALASGRKFVNEHPAATTGAIVGGVAGAVGVVPGILLGGVAGAVVDDVVKK